MSRLPSGLLVRRIKATRRTRDGTQVAFLRGDESFEVVIDGKLVDLVPVQRSIELAALRWVRAHDRKRMDRTMRLSRTGMSVMFLRNSDLNIEVWAGTVLVDTIDGRRARLPGLRSIERAASRWMSDGSEEKLAAALPFAAKSGPR